MLNGMSTQQIAIRLSEDQLAAVDDLVDRGVYANRAAAVRAAIDVVVELDQRRRIDDAVIEGYLRCPPTHPEHDAAVASMRDAIIEEPW